jgi:hypothetical protein
MFIWRYDFSTNIATVFAGKIGGGTGFCGDGGPASSALLNFPRSIWLTSASELYIADTNNHRIRKVVATIITTVVGDGGGTYAGDNGLATSANLRNPRSVYMDTNGKLFIADTINCRIRLVDTNNIITTFAGTGTAAPSMVRTSQDYPQISINLMM